MKSKSITQFIFLFIFFLQATLVFGLSSKPNLTSFDANPEVRKFAKVFAKTYKKNEKKVYAFLIQAEYKQSVINAISRPAERILEWKDYRKIFMKKDRVAKGVDFWKKHYDTLIAVSKQYQVDPEVIVAILGVETWYGQNQGGYRVLDSLMTLSFHYPKRAKFFKKELENFLLLIDEQKLDGTQLKGSYAGAMGYGQFMPSSYRAYAKSFKGKGPVDIWKNPEDAIASIANYLHEHHWRYGDLTAMQLPNSDIKITLISKKLKPNKTIADFAQSIEIPFSIAKNAEATLMKMEGEQGKEYWLGFHNFYVISRYNISSLYSLAVFQLSQSIKYEMNII